MTVGEFRTYGMAHLVVAVLLALYVGLTTARIVRSSCGERLLLRPAVALCGLLLVQIGLGAATWVTHYGFPSWLSGYSWAAGYTVVAQSHLQIHLTTGHVACGSLIFVTATILALRSLRLLQAGPRTAV